MLKMPNNKPYWITLAERLVVQAMRDMQKDRKKRAALAARKEKEQQLFTLEARALLKG
ncbi:MAG TPA: hypothetical protein PKI24_21025 [Nitrospira sp.]|nr:hypothetical protein [Nitrospira sp.]HNM20369.1 hypothetical protein [Nitrospira sp.]HNP42094.1 hypothetical protein [Nitrospira sp.]